MMEKIEKKTIRRAATKAVRRISENFRVLLVTGPRQVGKTTLLKQQLPDGMRYVTLDDEVLRESARSDPRGFLEEHPWPLMIDEVQYAPELFPYIKMKVDEAQERGMYWLTGSQQFRLMKNVQESLAGRVGIIELNSLTYQELMGAEFRVFNPEELEVINERTNKEGGLGTVGVNELYEVIFRGGMPELAVNEALTKEDFFKGYLDTYISRDVEGVVDVRDRQVFRRFMRVLATYNGERLNYSNIANAVHVSDKTIRSWVDILVTSGIVYLLEPFYHSNLGQISHMPKLMFMDQGLASYLEGWREARALQLSARAGNYLEAFVISELIKSYGAAGLDLQINYFYGRAGDEIDLVISQNGRVFPFEIKKTATPKMEMISAFWGLRKYVSNTGGGGLICLYDDLLKIRGGGGLGSGLSSVDSGSGSGVGIGLGDSDDVDWIVPVGVVIG